MPVLTRASPVPSGVGREFYLSPGAGSWKGDPCETRFPFSLFYDATMRASAEPGSPSRMYYGTISHNHRGVSDLVTPVVPLFAGTTWG